MMMMVIKFQSMNRVSNKKKKSGIFFPVWQHSLIIKIGQGYNTCHTYTYIYGEINRTYNDIHLIYWWILSLSNEMKWKQKIGHEVETIRYEFIQEMAASFFLVSQVLLLLMMMMEMFEKIFSNKSFFWLVQSGYHHLSSTGFEKIRFYWFKFFLDDDYTHIHCVCVFYFQFQGYSRVDDFNDFNDDDDDCHLIWI